MVYFVLFRSDFYRAPSVSTESVTARPRYKRYSGVENALLALLRSSAWPRRQLLVERHHTKAPGMDLGNVHGVCASLLLESVRGFRTV